MNSSTVIPKIQLLSNEQINEVHRYSIKILEKTGIRVESDEARKLFGRSEGVKTSKDIVFIQEDLISHAIKQASSDINVYTKSGETAFQMGKVQGNETYFGIGVTNTYFQEPDNTRIESFTRKHMQQSTKMGDLLDNYDMISTLGILSDVDPRLADLYSALDMSANTDKPLVLLVHENNALNKVFDLLSHLYGDISDKPFCIPYLNPISPLVINTSTSDKMIASIRNNLPVMYSNYGMYGGTTPITEGGTLALLNAELLAGLVFSQLIKEGSQIILGSLPASFNMISMGSCYTSSSYLLNLACAEMMDFYELPHCGTSGSNNGWGGDLPASADLWQNHLTSCIGKVGCAPFVGGTFDSMVFSPAAVVLSNYIIGASKKFARGFDLTPETVNLSEIDRISHGGNYFLTEQTLKHISDLKTEQNIWPSFNLDKWRELGSPKADKFLTDHIIERYATASTASKENIDIIKKGEDYIEKKLT